MQFATGSHVWQSTSRRICIPLAAQAIWPCFPQERAGTMYAAAGLQSMLIFTDHHTPCAVYLPSLGKWIYQDATYDERATVGTSTVPASPAELFAAKQAGTAIKIVKQLGPSWDPSYFM